MVEEVNKTEEQQTRSSGTVEQWNSRMAESGMTGKQHSMADGTTAKQRDGGMAYGMHGRDSGMAGWQDIRDGGMVGWRDGRMLVCAGWWQKTQKTYPLLW
jgi:hypothetical protein